MSKFKLNDVNLLIFDFDGTLCLSDEAILKVLKKAFSENDIDVAVDRNKIISNAGKPAEQFYKSILGSEYFHLWRKLSDKYDSTIPQFETIIPGVKETLKDLRDRKYNLALYSNCEVTYFNSIFHFLKIKDYFDYTECVGENNLTKIDLVDKIISKFPNSKSAIIGDRIQDIEAAKANNILSVGALYGYGKDEAEKADFTIDKFSDLLDIFKIVT
ncbi:MAG: HAD family hydrolase [Candidatus Pacebacteria bacterium]|nr:HAD family hydrolase [Candidatus Paceibacterota bacterium]